MLVLTRKVNQSIRIDTSDGPIIITIVRAGLGSTVRVGIDAPEECRVLRSEVAEAEEAGGQRQEETQTESPQ